MQRILLIKSPIDKGINQFFRARVRARVRTRFFKLICK
jgi:hypothetical protein